MGSPPLERLGRLAARHGLRRWLPLAPEAAVVSVTFDDILGSAARTGARILEDHGGRGTFYAAGSLTGGQEDGRAAHTLDALLSLQAAGHEIGSHGWAHQAYARAPAGRIRDDLDRNLAYLRRHLGPRAGEHFAYPFGRYGLRSKRLVAARHASARILGGGLHQGRADLNLLGCHRFYGEGRQPAAWRGWLDALAPGGWLLLNTHEVEPDCGPYGCRPGELDAFVAAACRRGCLILPVGEAIAYWRARA
ncbi:polysaccharide deacetylase family protein [Castellaniella defragrans]|jgi:peptidoglycan/xylan/chitin deacetylase (PgdA/CDA1 family)|uniref:Polysaccharide deacetylase n=3 Tax=Castellaniella defragrans TaxID=75697 RepID=W8X9U6_CASD6|nr:polysaccharide deacetylase family protein [Castellaniella defragrans]MBB6083293.1 peptidoglycan/xylan/chitin deacetylase (PgdA/CDA1 family) [Castellaniella defragrans]CDM25440.1 Polysaccharide deacetylase [Castellaniella defragrans 65Phen]